MSVITKTGIVVSVTGTSIICSNGSMYSLSGNVLYGPCNTIIARNVATIQEALNIVIGLCGGKDF